MRSGIPSLHHTIWDRVKTHIFNLGIMCLRTVHDRYPSMGHELRGIYGLFQADPILSKSFTLLPPNTVHRSAFKDRGTTHSRATRGAACAPEVDKIVHHKYIRDTVQDHLRYCLHHHSGIASLSPLENSLAPSARSVNNSAPNPRDYSICSFCKLHQSTCGRGKNWDNDDWSFGQILTLSLWFPALLEMLYILIGNNP